MSSQGATRAAPGGTARPNALVRLIEGTGEAVGRFAGYLLLVLTFVVCYDVVKRAFFDQPTIWAQETSAMLFGTFIILGGAATARTGGHVNMDIVYNRFSTRTKAILDVLTFFLLTVPFLGVLVWKGGISAWDSILKLEHDSSQWGPPLYPFRTMLPLGALLFLLQATVKMCRDFLTILHPHRERS